MLSDPGSGPQGPPPNLPPELAAHPRYRILRELGRGGMGVVYQARQTVMDRQVVIKVISKALLEHPDAVERFRREVQAAACLSHPNIVTAYDAEQAGELHMLVMEFVPGQSLAEVLKRKGPLEVAHACHFARQAALGLQHAHEQGMVHRDIKPANLMLTPKGQVKVLDFGLAKLASEQSQGKALTASGAYMGTPEYSAPEQASDARSADIRADVYSLGCTLYCLLAGRSPFSAGTAVQIILAHMMQEPPPLPKLRPDVPAGLWDVMAKMMAKAPAQRFRTPAEVARALLPFIKRGQREPSPASAALPRGTVLPGRGAATTGGTVRMASPAVQASPFQGLGETAPEQRIKMPPTSAGPWRTRWRLVAGVAALLIATVVFGLVLLAVLYHGPQGTPSGSAQANQTSAKTETGPQKGKPFTNAAGMRFVWIAPGSFTMGSPAEEVQRDNNETPHRVTLTRGFHMAACLVTQAQWERVLGKDANRSNFMGKDDDEKAKLPVDNVSWFDCVEFYIKLSEQEDRKPCYRLTNVTRGADGAISAADVEVRADGTGYRLPSEAQWEYACRAGTQTPFWWGSSITTNQANYNGTFVFGNDGQQGENRQKTTRVDYFPANPWGLHDMGGNLWQWCEDWYSPYPAAEVIDQLNTSNNPNNARVLRGGSWSCFPWYCRAAFRSGFAPAGRNGYCGCRVALCLD